MAKMKGLGRGLEALLGGNNEQQASEGSLQNLSVDRLQPGKYQPRSRMDPASLEQLSDSIKAQGVMQPILVRNVGDNRYEIIAGERRWRAAQLAGLTEVPVLIREVPDEAALAMSLIENIQRENLNPLEEAAGIQRLLDEFEMTHQSAADAVGRSRSAVTNLLRLLSLAPPVQEMLMHGRIDMGHARSLLPLGLTNQIEAAHEVINKQMSVREAERLVQRMMKPAQKPAAKADRDIERLQEELSDRLGTAVVIKPGKSGSGKLVIEYSSHDQLDSIIQKL